MILFFSSPQAIHPTACFVGFLQDKCGCLPKRPNPRSQLYLLWGLPRNFLKISISEERVARDEVLKPLAENGLTLRSCFLYNALNTSICIIGTFCNFRVFFWGVGEVLRPMDRHTSTMVIYYKLCALGASSWSFSISTCKKAQILSNPLLWV